MSKASLNKAVEAAAAELNKTYGDNTVMRLGAGKIPHVEVIPSGSISLDMALGCGGYPKGRIIEIYGPECVDADTFVQYEVRGPDGARQNHKGGTIERLFHRFHGLLMAGKGSYQRPKTADSAFYAPSINEEGRVFQNRIENVIHSGEKECYLVQLAGGASIIATAEHRFFTGAGYTKLGALMEGDAVYVHNGTPFRGDLGRAAPARATVMVKHHPHAPIKKVYDKIVDRTYVYHRTSRARIAYEAHINDLDYAAYVGRLNAGELAGLKFLEPEMHVHHRDEDYENDHPSNLQAITPEEHGRLHATERHNNLRFVVTEDQIVSIEPVGKRDTYDISMAAPANNFVANGIVVHNSSGKTTLALHAVANLQKAGGVAAIVDAEHALDMGYAKALGVDVGGLYLSQPDYGEQALEVVEGMIQSKSIGIVVVDSVAALTPKAELEGDFGRHGMGEHARLMSQAMRKLTAMTHDTGTVLIFINQIRMKIGVMFGNPEVTTGGNALKFYASVRLDVRRREKVKETRKGEDAETVGNITEVKVVKNKMAPPFKECKFSIIYGKGIDAIGDVLDNAMEQEIVSKGGGWYSYKGEKIGHGYHNAVKALEDSPIMLEQIYKDLTAKLMAPRLAVV